MTCSLHFNASRDVMTNAAAVLAFILAPMGHKATSPGGALAPLLFRALTSDWRVGAKIAQPFPIGQSTSIGATMKETTDTNRSITDDIEDTSATHIQSAVVPTFVRRITGKSKQEQDLANLPKISRFGRCGRICDERLDAA